MGRIICDCLYTIIITPGQLNPCSGQSSACLTQVKPSQTMCAWSAPCKHSQTMHTPCQPCPLQAACSAQCAAGSPAPPPVVWQKQQANQVRCGQTSTVKAKSINSTGSELGMQHNPCNLAPGTAARRIGVLAIGCDAHSSVVTESSISRLDTAAAKCSTWRILSIPCSPVT